MRPAQRAMGPTTLSIGTTYRAVRPKLAQDVVLARMLHVLNPLFTCNLIHEFLMWGQLAFP